MKMNPLILLPLVPRKKRKRPRALPFPRRAELAYSAELFRIVKQTEAVITRELVQRLERFVPDRSFADGRRADDAADELEVAMGLVRAEMTLTDAQALQIAAKMLIDVQRAHAIAFGTAYNGVLAINPFLGEEPWLREQMGLYAQENARLITSLPEDLIYDVQGVVSRGILEGQRHESIAVEIAGRFGVAENRALLIASDQVGKWFGSLNKLRQLDAGVEEYDWLTANDGAVRPTHKALHMKRRKWGVGIEPGQEVRCRCQPIPVIPDYDVAEGG